MNKEMLKLWEKASIRYSVYETLKPQDERKSIPELFSELIIKECCNIVHSKTDESIRVVMAIEQHFGVEE